MKKILKNKLWLGIIGFGGSIISLSGTFDHWPLTFACVPDIFFQIKKSDTNEYVHFKFLSFSTCISNRILINRAKTLKKSLRVNKCVALLQMCGSKPLFITGNVWDASKKYVDCCKALERQAMFITIHFLLYSLYGYCKNKYIKSTVCPLPLYKTKSCTRVVKKIVKEAALLCFSSVIVNKIQENINTSKWPVQ